MNKEQLIELGLNEEQVNKVLESQKEDKSLTREQFLKMSYSERVQLNLDQPEIYNTLSKKQS